jgi:hypothetical protein
LFRARATSAAPTFFRPFVNSRTNEGFIDGAIFYNNPIRIANYESRLIWPDVGDKHPDILLSIGTGHNGADTEGYVDNSSRFDQRRVQSRNVLRKPPPPERQAQFNHPALRAFPEIASWINVLFRRVDNILDSEALWQDFHKDVRRSSSIAQAQRYTRINPRVGFKTPKMDEKNQIDHLYDDVASRLRTEHEQNKFVRIAYRLVASCFYFEQSGAPREVDDHFEVQGA